MSQRLDLSGLAPYDLVTLPFFPRMEAEVPGLSGICRRTRR